MPTPLVVTLDGNEAVAHVAHRASEVIAIYPITPASPMGESADTWSAQGRTNLWGTIPEVIEMQSEAGAAGALHGALQAGALATTFTASQGLLLMLPDLYKIVGELSPAVLHVAARTVATHALSIFGDHSDVMAARPTGVTMMCSGSVQEAHDLAAVAHAVALRTRVPVLHFFDGFRTSHEVGRVSLLADDDLGALLPPEAIDAHRRRALSPDTPILRGSAHNPDTFFQAREAANPFHEAVPGAVEEAFELLASRSGRHYGLVDYHGHPEAERVVVLMGSGTGASRDAVDALVAGSERVGVLSVHLYRPFPAASLLAALPPSTRSLAVLDRTKEPGAGGEPLLLDVRTAVADAADEGTSSLRDPHPRIIGGRYGLGGKDLTPAMVAAVFDELGAVRPRRRVTVGITDDVGHSSLRVEPDRFPEPDEVFRAVLVGLGSDGTVGASRNTIRIIGEQTGRHAQGFFVYDSRKSGSVTESHLRVSADPIRASYLVRRAQFVGCHHLRILERLDVLDRAAPGATVLLNSPHGPDGTWDHLPAEVQQQILDRDLRCHVVDADRVAAEAGLGGYVSTVLQACFFRLCDLLEPDHADRALEDAITASYGRLGEAVLAHNFAAIAAAAGALETMPTAGRSVTGTPRSPLVDDRADEVTRRVTALQLRGRGDLAPVSAFAPDGTWPLGTARYDKRLLGREIPVWDPDLCIDCGKCALDCPHAAVRTVLVDPAALAAAPDGFAHKAAKDHDGFRLVVQVYPDDCTGCGICVEVCPARSRTVASHKALDLAPSTGAVRDRARAGAAFVDQLPDLDPDGSVGAADQPQPPRPVTVRSAQLRRPLFEFSGACAGCGETPYLKLLTQLFGDRMVVANATGCSSIYGGNLPVTPWATGHDGRGPAWSNSLFEDNAEFGLGIRLGLDHRREVARSALAALAGEVGDDLVGSLLEASGADATDPTDDRAVAAQRERVGELRRRLRSRPGPTGADPALVRILEAVADDLVPRQVWIVGGDGWAYDIGFGGLDHVLASGHDVNVLVMDTEGYSNTGGQASKATARGAVAKYASAGKGVRKKDLGMLAAGYGHVYVAQVAVGAHDLQTVRALTEAASWHGPSLVLAYSHCIAHGFDLRGGPSHQRAAVRSGYWPLFRYDPRHAHRGDHPFRLDSRPPSIPFSDFAATEARFSVLARTDPERAARLATLAQHDIDERWHFYEQLGEVERWADDDVDPTVAPTGPPVDHHGGNER